RRLEVNHRVRLAGLVEYEVGTQLTERARGGLSKEGTALSEAVFEQLIQLGIQLHPLNQPPNERVVEPRLPGTVVVGLKQRSVKSCTKAQRAGARVGAWRTAIEGITQA
nr:hypothetical protein [Tanacetum cinerariifolium]